MDRNTVLRNISSKEMTSGIIWIVIGAIQILIGVSLISYYWVTLIVGIWNVCVGIGRTKNADKIEERGNNVVEEYKKSITSMIVFLVLNILIGGLIGVIGAIYDLVTRNYVLTNKNIILGNTSNDYSTNNGEGNKYEDLERLMKLKNDGVITEVEFEIEKRKILG